MPPVALRLGRIVGIPDLIHLAEINGFLRPRARQGSPAEPVARAILWLKEIANRAAISLLEDGQQDSWWRYPSGNIPLRSTPPGAQSIA